MTRLGNQNETYRVLFVLYLFCSGGYFRSMVQYVALKVFVVVNVKDDISHASLRCSPIGGRKGADHKAITQQELLIESCYDKVSA